ncbi:MAG: hypothetical protein WAT20_08495 [Ferruginibacter sp.]|nr:hypothetical protein [Chitinophagaceae bacterium]
MKNNHHFKRWFGARVIIIITTVFFSLPAISQVTIWSVNFNNGCTSNCLASTYAGWTIQNNVGGVNGGAPNDWFVSCAEEGIAPPGCGSSCIGDASLHIGSDPGAGGDMGASYNETGATNATYKLVVSPIISTVNRQTLTLKFDFIAFGSSACSEDRAQLRLSTNGGATWPVGYQYCLTSVCCGACNGYSQGQWTTYTLALPAAFEGNPNVRIAFHWMNNGNGSGTDPSVAIDDIVLSGLVALSANVVNFNAVKETSKVKLSWTTNSETQVNRYEVERSASTAGFAKITSVAAKGNQQPGNINYTANDAQLFTAPVFYRLKTVDNTGGFKYSNIIRVGNNAAGTDDITLIAVNGAQGNIKASLWSGHYHDANITLYDMEGKLIKDFGKKPIVKGENQLSLYVPRIPVANYILKVEVPKSGNKKPVSLSGKFNYTK